jgi:hypothetical protein
MPARHVAVTLDKTTFRAAMTTLFPHLGDEAVDEGWARLRTEATVEEIRDVVRPLHGLATRLQQARRDGRRWRS